MPIFIDLLLEDNGFLPIVSKMFDNELLTGVGHRFTTNFYRLFIVSKMFDSDLFTAPLVHRFTTNFSGRQPPISRARTIVGT